MESDDNSLSNNVGRLIVKDFAKITEFSPKSTKSSSSFSVSLDKSKKNSRQGRKLEPITDDDSVIAVSPAKRTRISTIDDSATPSTSNAKRSTIKKSTKVKDIREPPSNNKLISQFFKPVAQLSSSSHRKTKVEKANETLEKRMKQDEVTGKENSERAISVTIPKARRRLCPGTNLKLVSNRYHGEDQTRMSNFYDKTEESEFDYYTTTKKSKLPVIIDGELDVESCLGICLTEESRVLDFNESLEMETDKPIEQMQQELAQLIDRVENPVRDESHDEREKWNMEMQMEYVQNLTQQNTFPDTTPSDRKNEPRIKRTVICPKYKIISGSTFAVDAFRYGYIEGITHYFLTHFHSDHYIGLKKTFSRPIILSSITACCVKKFVKIDSQFLIELNPNETMKINNIEITALDANHCPGALMFAFRFPDNQLTLHVGDFRATPHMESYPIFWSFDVNELYLDTTYLTSKYSLSSQEDCIKLVIEEATSYFEKHALDKVLVIVGAYVIGKEKVWTALAEKFNLKVWADKNRRDALEAINDPEMMQYLVNDPKHAQMHVINMGFVNYDDLKNYLNQFENTFTHILAFRPSGWEKKSKPRHQGKISIVGVEYSEHSSYDELRRFVGFLRPKTIISTVPTGKDPNITPTIPQEWYRGEIKPIREKTQLKIYDFAGGTNTSNIPNSVPNTTRLNPSAIKRRARTNEKVSKLEVSTIIDLDSD